METETLSNYEQTQDKHILDESMDVNISRNDEENDSLGSNELSGENSDIKHKQVIDNNSEGNKELVNYDSTENRENENSDCDKSITSEEDYRRNKLNSDNDDEDELENEKEVIESEETNKNVNDNCKRNSDEGDGDNVSLNEEKDSSREDQENDSFTDEEKGSLNDEEKDSINDEHRIEHVSFSDVEKDPLDDENQKGHDPFDEKEDNDQEKKDSEQFDQGKTIQEDPLPVDDKKIEHEEGKDTDIPNDEKVDSHTEENNESQLKDEENEKTEDDKNNKTDVNSSPHQKNEDEEENREKNDIIKECPLLKETLTKVNEAANDSEQQKDADENGFEEDMDMDEDFDPSLLCPDIAMEVDEAPVITTNDNVPNDGSKSPLLYEPVFSTYVDEMTGAEVTFNLSPEEHQLRQQTYGEDNPIQYTKIHCTACNVHLGSALDGQSNRFVHPLLKVLICKDCYHFYTSGEFEKDEDGSELYCRWCGQGGQVMCCSGCEMVFCKKCVRINFGRRKLAEIRDSDDWFCFRCNTSQLTPLRVHCAEFMEYVRREISRAATLENATSFMTTDFSQCCLSQKKKHNEPSSGEPKKKKRKSSIDPDYDPFREQDSPQPSTSGVKLPTVEVSKPVPILPKPIAPKPNSGIITQVSPSTTLFKVGNTTFRPKGAAFSQPRPRVQIINPGNASVIRPSSGPGYIKIMPGGVRVTPTNSRTQNTQNFISSNSIRSQPTFNQRLSRPVGNATSQMKHEWFEKTVRAAARVNSNLSYTLTQLNRAQASAGSVEALAVVHNKLQEILSTSINSLIQIRKNLRTEFIAGIKNIRFPANKPPPPPQPSTSAQDDDVIFISPSPSPVPPPIAVTSVSMSPLSSINLPPSVSLTKKVIPPASTILDPIPSTSKGTTNEMPKVFLRVKSLTALQNVPSECITIPDDPLPPPPPLTLLQPTRAATNFDCSDMNGIIIKDVKSVVETDPLETDTDEKLVNKSNENVEVNVKEKSEGNAEGNVEGKSEGTAEEKSEGSVEDKLEGSVEKKSEENAEEKYQENKEEKWENNVDISVVTNGEKESNEECQVEDVTDSNENENNKENFKFHYDLKDHPSAELKKMLSTKVYIKRSEEIDELVKKTFGLVNGNTSE